MPAWSSEEPPVHTATRPSRRSFAAEKSLQRPSRGRFFSGNSAQLAKIRRFPGKDTATHPSRPRPGCRWSRSSRSSSSFRARQPWIGASDGSGRRPKAFNTVCADSMVPERRRHIASRHWRATRGRSFKPAKSTVKKRRSSFRIFRGTRACVHGIRLPPAHQTKSRTACIMEKIGF